MVAAARRVRAIKDAAMHEMPMPGDWAMSMAWMRMPDESWLWSATSFLGMWTLMMVAMMMPSLAPSLLRYRAAMSRANGTQLIRTTALAGVGYFSPWVALGVVVYPLGVLMAEAAMAYPALSRAVPIAVGVVIVMAGGLQFTAWKRRALACCREGLSCSTPGRDGAWTALRHGIRLGLHCTTCCAGATAVLLVVGVMNVAAMMIVAAAITLERLAPAGGPAARAIGVAAIVAGLVVIARAALMG